MINYYYKTVKEPKLQTLDDFRKGVWIYVENPSQDELNSLSEKHGLERDLLDDAIDPYEVPRVEIENKKTYVYSRIPATYKDIVNTRPVMTVMAEDFVRTVVKEHHSFLNPFLNGNIDFYTTQKTKLFLQIFLELMNTYTRYLTRINKKVRSISGGIEEVKNRDIAEFVKYENTLNDFLAALVPTDTLLRKILSGRFFQLFEQDEDLIEDILVEAGQILVVAKATLRNIVNVRNAYSTIMSNNLNRVIKILTALTIVLTVPTLIASVFGMNVDLPGMEGPYAFWYILGGSVAVSGFLLYIFARNEWI